MKLNHPYVNASTRHALKVYHGLNVAVRHGRDRVRARF